MKDITDLNPLLGISILYGVITLFLTILVILIQLFNLAFQPNVIVSIDNKTIYQGSNACIKESSLGSATHVQIGRGPLCLFPGPKYTSKNVITRPE